MRSVKKIKHEILKLNNKRTGLTLSKKHPGTVIQDSLGNKYRVVDGRKELINDEVLKQEIKKQEQAIVTVQTRQRRSKVKVAAPKPGKKKQKTQ